MKPRAIPFLIAAPLLGLGAIDAAPFTSAIEVTTGRFLLRAVAPDRETGKPTEVALPPGALGPNMTCVTGTPLGVQMDRFWNTPSPTTGRSPRQEACSGPQGLTNQVQRRVRSLGSGFSAYNIVCNLASTGIVVAKQVGSTIQLSYQLLNNTVEFRATSPVTCHPAHGQVFCPNDPLFSIRFATEIMTTIQARGVCELAASGGTVNLHAVNIDTHNVSGDAFRNLVDPIFLGNRLTAAELAIQAAQRQVPLPLDAAFQELRGSAACNQGTPQAAVLASFTETEAKIEPREGGIILEIRHPTIAPPRFQNVSLPSGPDTCRSGFVFREAFPGDTVCVTPERRAQTAEDNAAAASRRVPGGAWGPNTCQSGYVWRIARPEDLVCVTPERRAHAATDNAQASGRRVLQPGVPSFARPSITVQPVVVAGTRTTVSGQLFPPTMNLATVQRLSIDRDTTSVCNGGATELEWGRAAGELRVQRLRGERRGGGGCASRHEVAELSPGTAYQFRARDCDAITCSAWSEPITLNTESVDPEKGKVLLALDGATVGTATVDADGKFETSIEIPAGTGAGTHTIHATSGAAKAQEKVQVTAAGGAAGGGNGTLVLTGSFFGDTGCPMRPLQQALAAIDEGFSLFGSGFAAGTVTIHIDSPTGPSVGAATVKSDGTFCGEFKGPAADMLGDHKLVAVQNGAVRATSPVKFVRPTVVK